MKIGIGNDHSAYALKQTIKAYLESQGHEVVDYGAYSAERSNYPEFGEKVARAIVRGEVERGVLICGTGVGISIAANKVKGIRAAVCSEPVTASFVRRHNDAQIIAFGARIVGEEMAKAIVDAYFGASFEGGRHQTRIDMLMDIENRD